jgi:hypothetical protein
MSVIPALRRLRQEDHKVEVSLGYTVTVSKKSVCTGHVQTLFSCHYSLDDVS